MINMSQLVFFLFIILANKNWWWETTHNRQHKNANKRRIKCYNIKFDQMIANLSTLNKDNNNKRVNVLCGANEKDKYKL